MLNQLFWSTNSVKASLNVAIQPFYMNTAQSLGVVNNA